MPSTMQTIDHVKAGHLFSGIFTQADYKGSLGYKELLKSACEGKFNGFAVSMPDCNSRSCILVFIDGEPDCAMFFDPRGSFYGHAAESLLKRGDQYKMFRVDEDRLRGYVGDLSELVKEQTAELYHTNAQLLDEIRELKEREISLRNNERFYREIVEKANSIILKIDRDGTISFVNEFAEKFFGYAAAEVINRHMVGTLLPDTREVSASFRELLANILLYPEEFGNFQKEHCTHDGCSVWVSWTTQVLRDDQGEISGALCIGSNITDQKKTEEILRASEAKFRLLAEESPNMILVTLDGRILYANPRCEEIMGYSQEELYNPLFNFFELIVPEDRDISTFPTESRQSEADIDPLEYTFITRDGKRVEAILSAKMIEYEGEAAILGVVTDITERKRTELKILQSKRLYRAIFETTGTATMIVDQSGAVILANAEFERLFGYSKDEIEGRKVLNELFVPEEREKMRGYHYLRRVDSNSAPRQYESRLVDRDGNIRDITLMVSMIPDTQRSIVSLTDITDSKMAENAMRESEKRYRLLAENAKDVIWTMNLYLDFTYVSPSVNHLLDYSPEECLNMQLEEILTPASYARARRVFVEELNREVRNRDSGQELKEMEFECIRRDGSTVWIEARITILHDSKKIPCGLLGVARDITDRKQIDRIRQEALDQIEKNMEQFAVLNDHIRNPLQAIVGLADLEGGQIAKSIYEQALEIDSIIKQLDVGWLESAKIREFLRKHYNTPTPLLS